MTRYTSTKRSERYAISRLRYEDRFGSLDQQSCFVLTVFLRELTNGHIGRPTWKMAKARIYSTDESPHTLCMSKAFGRIVRFSSFLAPPK